ncbi:MAG TPA: hypothetical protein VM910_37275, partial [Bradyrhizobium sp.]|nr:hypothetical protein [Bradyrhizobium sp.]
GRLKSWIGFRGGVLGRNLRVLVSLLGLAAPLMAQGGATPRDSGATLHIESRAVLVDVIVTDQHGNPVTGLKQDAFSVTEQGKPQPTAGSQSSRLATRCASTSTWEAPTS